MNEVIIHKQAEGVPYERAYAGSICEILEASDPELVGMLCVKPYQSNQCTVILNTQRGSTDNNLGIKRVRQLQPGDSFTVVIGG